MTRELAEPLLEDSPEAADVLRFANCWRRSARALVVGCAYGALLWAVVYLWAVGAAGVHAAMLLATLAVVVPCMSLLWLVLLRRSLLVPTRAASVAAHVPPSDTLWRGKLQGSITRAWDEGIRRFRGKPRNGARANGVVDLEAGQRRPPLPGAAPDADCVEREIVIDAPASVVFDAMTDFEKLPLWANGINEVVEETPPGIRAGERRIRFNSGVMGLNVTYTLAYTLVRPTRVSWVSVAGAVKRIVGEYVLTPLGASRTQVNYRLEVDAGFNIPGPVRRAVNGLVVGAALPALKRYVESAARRPSGLDREHKAALAELRSGPEEQPAPGWAKCSSGGFVRSPVRPGSEPAVSTPDWVECSGGGFVRSPAPPGSDPAEQV